MDIVTQRAVITAKKVARLGKERFYCNIYVDGPHSQKNAIESQYTGVSLDGLSKGTGATDSNVMQTC